MPRTVRVLPGWLRCGITSNGLAWLARCRNRVASTAHRLLRLTRRRICHGACRPCSTLRALDLLGRCHITTLLSSVSPPPFFSTHIHRNVSFKNQMFTTNGKSRASTWGKPHSLRLAEHLIFPTPLACRKRGAITTASSRSIPGASEYASAPWFSEPIWPLVDRTASSSSTAATRSWAGTFEFSLHKHLRVAVWRSENEEVEVGKCGIGMARSCRAHVFFSLRFVAPGPPR